MPRRRAASTTAGRASSRAPAVDARAGAPPRRRRGARRRRGGRGRRGAGPSARRRRAPRAVHRHGGLGGVRRRRAAQRGDVVDERAVGVVADRRDDRHAEQRHRPAQRLVAEAEEVGQRAAAARDDDDVDLAGRGEVLDGARDRAARRGDPGRARTPRRSAPPSRGGCRPGEHVVARLAALAGDDADRARQRRPGEQLLRLEEALGVERLAQPVELGEQVALAGDPQARDGERERRRRGPAADVVVQPAADDDLRAVAQRALAEAQQVEVRRATSSTAARPGRRAARSRPARGVRRRFQTSPKSCTRERWRR